MRIAGVIADLYLVGWASSLSTRITSCYGMDQLILDVPPPLALSQSPDHLPSIIRCLAEFASEISEKFA
jgi:hypothetical protein